MSELVLVNLEDWSFRNSLGTLLEAHSAHDTPRSLRHFVTSNKLFWKSISSTKEKREDIRWAIQTAGGGRQLLEVDRLWDIAKLEASHESKLDFGKVRTMQDVQKGGKCNKLLVQLGNDRYNEICADRRLALVAIHYLEVFSSLKEEHNKHIGTSHASERTPVSSSHCELILVLQQEDGSRIVISAEKRGGSDAGIYIWSRSTSDDVIRGSDTGFYSTSDDLIQRGPSVVLHTIYCEMTHIPFLKIVEILLDADPDYSFEDKDSSDYAKSTMMRLLRECLQVNGISDHVARSLRNQYHYLLWDDLNFKEMESFP